MRPLGTVGHHLRRIKSLTCLARQNWPLLQHSRDHRSIARQAAGLEFPSRGWRRRGGDDDRDIGGGWRAGGQSQEQARQPVAQSVTYLMVQLGLDLAAEQLQVVFVGQDLPLSSSVELSAVCGGPNLGCTRCCATAENRVTLSRISAMSARCAPVSPVFVVHHRLDAAGGHFQEQPDGLGVGQPVEVIVPAHDRVPFHISSCSANHSIDRPLRSQSLRIFFVTWAFCRAALNDLAVVSLDFAVSPSPSAYHR